MNAKDGFRTPPKMKDGDFVRIPTSHIDILNRSDFDEKGSFICLYTNPHPIRKDVVLCLVKYMTPTSHSIPSRIRAYAVIYWSRIQFKNMVK